MWWGGEGKGALHSRRLGAGEKTAVFLAERVVSGFRISAVKPPPTHNRPAARAHATHSTPSCSQVTPLTMSHIAGRQRAQATAARRPLRLASCLFTVARAVSCLSRAVLTGNYDNLFFFTLITPFPEPVNSPSFVCVSRLESFPDHRASPGGSGPPHRTAACCLRCLPHEGRRATSCSRPSS